MSVTMGDSLRRRRGGSRKGASGPGKGGRRGGDGGWPKVLAWALGLGLGAFLVGYGLATLVLFPAPAPPEDLLDVPDLRGRQVSDAAEMLLDLGLVLGVVDSLRHPSVDSGRVVGQAPLPGQLARADASVRITVSLGAERRVVPDVARLRADRAVRLLGATGFVVSADSVQADEPRGSVLEIDPAPGTELPLPGEVQVIVSLGPPRVAMPDLLGMTESAAVDTLSSLGLALAAVDTVFRFGRDQGRVVEQAPPADSLLERGAAVRLSVGRRGGPRE
ncbi:MAG: PASTA domain-containing protein [Gemmatimonadetes bacterium]|nr:PASTA domain-containing protein [Gemmatimonadota bacterium]